MLFFILYSCALAVPDIKSISIDQLYDIMYGQYEINSSSPTLVNSLTYNGNGSTVFILRQQGDTTTGDGFDFYDVSGTPDEMARFQASMQNVEQLDENITTLNKTHKVVFVQFTKQATYKQQAVFWVVIVTFIIFIGGVSSSLLLWHFDRYDLDPANSLLFVTEGNTIVSGINDPK